LLPPKPMTRPWHLWRAPLDKLAIKTLSPIQIPIRSQIAREISFVIQQPKTDNNPKIKFKS
jgi:hypothetical protein